MTDTTGNTTSKSSTEKNFFVMYSKSKGYFVLTAEKAERSWAEKIRGFATLREAEEEAYNATHGME
ncbi:MAG TPA: hypothetical protein VIH16_03765 [Bellilinea sp.]